MRVLRQNARTISEVVGSQLCSGCGVCAYLEPDRFSMGDSIDHGRRPIVLRQPEPEEKVAIAACPGAVVDRRALTKLRGIDEDLFGNWGPILEIWEGYSCDPEIRISAASGGASTAIALYAIERGGMTGVLHTGAKEGQPLKNRTVYSRNRAELFARIASRYSPSSPCDGLRLIEQQEGESVFIGKPCDVQALYNANRIRPQLNVKVGLTIAFFCAGTPSERGTKELLKTIGVSDLDQVTSLRYRGNGWPGKFSVEYLDETNVRKTGTLTYTESWGYLERFRQWRCFVCPDHTGEFADISVGDPWFRSSGDEEPGRSLIVARTQRGVDFVQRACQEGYLNLELSDGKALNLSQPDLMRTRSILWARLLTLRLLAIPAPEILGYPLFRSWLHNLSVMEKIGSFKRTLSRILKYKLYKIAKPVTSVSE